MISRPEPTTRSLRQFSAAWLVLFLLVALRHSWNGGDRLTLFLLGGIGLVGAAGLIRPNAVRLLFLIVTTLTYPIGWLISHLVLAVMFFGLLTPLAVVFRLMGRDLLCRRRPPPRQSLWVTRSRESAPERYLHQY